VVYSASTLSPTIGWNTYTLSTPFFWDGIANIIIEVCRDGNDWWDNYGVQVTQFPVNDYRTYGLYDDGVAACSMTDGYELDNIDRRKRPNARFDIVAADGCSGQPDPVTITGPSEVCPGVAFTLSAEGVSIGTGLNYDWQYFNGTAWQATGNTGITYYVSGGITDPRDYRFITTCTNGGLSDTSAVKSITINPPNQCYCSAGSNSNRSEERRVGKE